MSPRASLDTLLGIFVAGRGLDMCTCSRLLGDRCAPADPRWPSAKPPLRPGRRPFSPSTNGFRVAISTASLCKSENRWWNHRLNPIASPWMGKHEDIPNFGRDHVERVDPSCWRWTFLWHHGAIVELRKLKFFVQFDKLVAFSDQTLHEEEEN